MNQRSLAWLTIPSLMTILAPDFRGQHQRSQDLDAVLIAATTQIPANKLDVGALYSLHREEVLCLELDA